MLIEHMGPQNKDRIDQLSCEHLSSSQFNIFRGGGEIFRKCPAAGIQMRWLKLKQASWTTKWKLKMMKKLSRRNLALDEDGSPGPLTQTYIRKK